MKNESKDHTVLITGATSGIGLELAKLFARDGYKMVLVARHANDLQQTVRLMHDAGAKEVITIAKDLSRPNAAQEVYEITKQRNMRVDILVNDAGVGEYGFFAETDLEKELNIIQLNISALVHLTKLYLKDMIKAGHGRLLQLASIASYQPTPKLTVYAATKAFVLSFSDALATELKEMAPGVTCTALLPNATDTDFFNKAGMENTKAAQNDPEDPAVVAEIGYKALMNGDLHAYAPGVKQQIVMGTFKTNEGIAKSARKQMEEQPPQKPATGK